MKTNLGKANLAALALIAVLSGYVALPAWKTAFGSSANKDWAVFPAIISVIMLGLLIWAVVETLRGDWMKKELEIKYPKPLVFGVVAVFVYYLLFRWFGYYLGSLFFSFASCCMYQWDVDIKKRLLNAALVTGIYLVFVYVMFEKILGFRL